MQDIFQGFSVEFISIAANMLLLLVLIIIIFKSSKKIKNLEAKYNRFMSGLSDKNIEDLIDTCLEEINNIKNKNRESENKINYLERNLLQCVQKTGIIRFNAFENVGSDLSFCIALLDKNDTGVIISSIYSRDNSTTYAKPIIGGKSKYTLSAEELQVLDIAKNTYNEKLYIPGNQ